MNIFINNAYRILGLPVTATKKEIVRRLDDIQTHIKIGQVPQYDVDFSWMNELNRNYETVNKAYMALESSESKIIHLLAWFWIIDKYDELALNALKNGDLNEAIKIWSKSP